MPLTFEQQRRYARQIQLEGFGEEAQLRLKTSHLVIIGAGGLGSASISTLAAAGVGHLTVIDHDRVELSNLNRQTLHETGDIGRLKTDSAGDRVAELNPEIRFTPISAKLTAENASMLISGADAVLDGCDNFPTRFAVSDACVSLRIPLISAALRGFEGQLATFAPHLGSGCYRCFVPEDVPDVNACRETGVIGPLAGVMGSMQAVEAIHMLTDAPQLLGKLLQWDARRFSQRVTALPRDPHCRTCAHAEPIAQ